MTRLDAARCDAYSFEAERVFGGTVQGHHTWFGTLI